MASGLSYQVGTDERPLVVSDGTTGNNVRNLHPNLPSSAEMNNIASVGGGVIVSHGGASHDRHRVGLGPGRTVAHELQQVENGPGVSAAALSTDLVVDLREDMVVAASGDPERFVGLVENHPPVHECVGIV